MVCEVVDHQQPAGECTGTRMPASVEQVMIYDQPVAAPDMILRSANIRLLRADGQGRLVPVGSAAVQFRRRFDADDLVARCGNPLFDRGGHCRRYKSGLRPSPRKRISQCQAPNGVAGANHRPCIDAKGYTHSRSRFTAAITMSCSSSRRSGKRGKVIASA